MRNCKICGKPINHTNGNRKTCEQCNHEIKGLPRVQQITIELDFFLNLLNDSKELEEIKKKKEELEIVQLRWPL